jgi:hypothetical protein
MAESLLSPLTLAFVLGIVACLLKSDLKFPDSIYFILKIYLLFSIGLKGGAQVSDQSWSTIQNPTIAAILLGIIIPQIAFVILNKVLKFSRIDASAISAHYGSVSAVTFMVGMQFCQIKGVEVESFMPALVAIMEIPGIIVALMLSEKKSNWQSMFSSVREIILGKSIVLLLGGFIIGMISGKSGLALVSGFFITPFHGILTLFLLQMGIIVGERLSDLKIAGLRILLFGIFFPLSIGTLGIWVAQQFGLSLGGAFILGLLSASASYIAAPAAVKSSLPEANPAYYLTASLGVTFPFNLIIGLPIYFAVAEFLYR